METVSQTIERGAAELGVALPPGAGAAFEKYYNMLEQRGKNVNLTAITGAQDVIRLHFLDSLALLGSADFQKARVIDVGSGAGFPGVPLKLAEPSIDLTLLDAKGKRVAFLSDLCAAIAIDAVCVHARAEELAHTPGMREQFDIAVSRAVAQLNILCELSLPFVRVGGSFLAMKSYDSLEEREEARNAIDTLGAKIDGSIEYTIPGAGIKRLIIVIRKTSATPEAYPRRFAKMQKAPL